MSLSQDSKIGLQKVQPARSGTLYLILIQVVSRGFTFVGNQILLRFLTPSHLGLAIQLEALSVSVLYTARESLRVALQRWPGQQRVLSKDASRKASTQSVVNLSYLVLLGGVFLALMFGSWYLYQAPLEVVDSPDFQSAFRLYAIATATELCSEQCFIIIQQHGLFRERARAETAGAITRCISACLTALVMSKRNMPLSVLPFAVGQFCYALSLSLSYLVAAYRVSETERFSLLPRKVPHATSSEYYLSLFYKPLVGLASAFYGQSIFKWLLTQGDTLILSLFADLQAQGIFALASNYGGLISRLLFQPIEESSRNVFGQLLSAIPHQSNGNPQSSAPTAYPAPASLLESEQTRSVSKERPGPNPTSKSESNTRRSAHPATNGRKTVEADASEDPIGDPKTIREAQRPTNTEDSPASQQHTENMDKALRHLTTVLHAYLLLIALPCMTLLPHLFPFLVRMLLGSGPASRWSTSDTFDLLEGYSYYIPCLAINGVLDAFVTSVATEAQLGVQSVLMLVITALYLGSAWVAIRWLGMGAVGLVGANILGMFLRIGYSVFFIRDWVVANVQDGRNQGTKLLRLCLPKMLCVASAVVVGIVLHSSHSSGSFGLVSSTSARGGIVTILQRFLDLKDVQRLQGLVPLDKLDQRLTSVLQNDVLLELGNIAAGALFLGATILFSEREFLLELFGPLLPHSIQGYLSAFLNPRSKIVPDTRRSANQKKD